MITKEFIKTLEQLTKEQVNFLKMVYNPRNICYDILIEIFEKSYNNRDKYCAVREWEINTICPDRETNRCICGQNIFYVYSIKNRINGNIIEPIGSVCITKFLPHLEIEIKEKKRKEKSRRERIEKPYLYCRSKIYDCKKKLTDGICKTCRNKLIRDNKNRKKKK